MSNQVRLDKQEKTIMLTALRVLKNHSVVSHEIAAISDLESKIESLIPDMTVITYDGEKFYSAGEEVNPSFESQ